MCFGGDGVLFFDVNQTIMWSTFFFQMQKGVSLEEESTEEIVLKPSSKHNHFCWDSTLGINRLSRLKWAWKLKEIGALTLLSSSSFFDPRVSEGTN